MTFEERVILQLLNSLSNIGQDTPSRKMSALISLPTGFKAEQYHSTSPRPIGPALW
jgi:hypothetical protein